MKTLTGTGVLSIPWYMIPVLLALTPAVWAYDRWRRYVISSRR